jgi:hypothetical protein
MKMMDFVNQQLDSIETAYPIYYKDGKRPLILGANDSDTAYDRACGIFETMSFDYDFVEVRDPRTGEVLS